MNEKILEMDNFISEEKVIEMAVTRLNNEYEDFKSYKGTEVFNRLLGIYNAEKDEAVVENDVYNKHMISQAPYIASGIAQPVLNLLVNFCKQNRNFANVILRCEGSFTSCLAYTIHAFIKDKKEDKNPRNSSADLSDIETYQRAIEYYCSSGKIQFVMKLELPDIAFSPITEEGLKEITQTYENSKILAKAEIEAKKKAEAEKKAKAEADKKAREEKERKKKEREEKKKKLEEDRRKFKEAQGSFLPEATENEVSVVPEKIKPKKSENPFVKKEDKTPENDNIIQLTLF